MTIIHTVSNHDDLIDIRDVIARVEELRETCDTTSSEEKFELADLEALLDDLRGNGGDEQWEGDWYPLTLIRDSYFRDYAQDLADDCGMIPVGNAWPCTCIDWDQAARELQMDYSATEFNGTTYWYR